MHNLNLMTLEELTALHATTSALVAAGKALVAHKVEPVFSLEPGQPARITLIGQGVSSDRVVEFTVVGEPVLPAFDSFAERVAGQEAAPTLNPEDAQMLETRRFAVQEIAGEGEAVLTAVDEQPVAGIPDSAPASESPIPEPEAHEPGPADAHAAEPVRANPTPEALPEPVAAPMQLRAGPLDEAERETILRRVSEGIPRKIIAADLGRRIQSVSLYLSSLEQAKSKVEAKPREAQKAPPPAPVKAPAKAAAPIPKPPAPPAPKITSPAPAPAPVTAEKQAEPVWHAPIDRHLTTLGYSGGWSAGLDLDLVEGLSKGIKLGMLATDLGLDTSALKSRFAALTQPLRDERGMMTLDDQKRLLTVLRSRAPATGSAA